MPIVVNLCGEGEHPGAINVNLLDPDLLTRKLETIAMSGPCIQADARQLPIASNAVDEIVGNMLPYSSAWTDELVAEALRVLRIGGTCRVSASAVGGAGLGPHLERAGFVNVGLLPTGYAHGVKS